MKNRDKWLYLGMIPTHQVLRIPISDFQFRFKLVTEGWVFTTKEAYERYVKFNGDAKVFIPTTHAGIQLYSHTFYTPQMINQIKYGENKNSK